MAFKAFAILLVASASMARGQNVFASALAAEAEGNGAALSLLQGRAAKIVKKRAAAAPGTAGRLAVPTGALMEDDLLGFGGGGGFGGVSLMQEKQARIKATSGACDMPAEPRKDAASRPAGGLSAALLAAAQDGVEDGMAALNLLQGSGARLEATVPRPPEPRSAP
mmetsp:Transcript_6101/g.17055  ORF Transcript_6101/g.17055 Transcript_6101/m.17055 type:complete len:166 (+) Transcript_6101:143-640(+)